MYSVVLAAMLTAGPAVAPAHCHGYSCCCGGYSCCCGGWYSSCCCGGWSSCCCGGYSCCCGGWYSSCCCGGYSCCCCGGYPSYYSSCCCGGYSCCCGGYALAPAYVAPAPAEAIPALPAPKPQAASSYQATVVVKAPMDATITVNGQSLDHARAEQVFTTPDLEQGKVYAYDFQAQVVRDGKTVTRNQKVTVKAGQQSRADFSELSRDDAPARVTITAPADARVTVDNIEIPASSRTFQTPTLENGRTYYYTVKADVVRNGKTVSDSKRVTLEAGKDVTVEFKEPTVATAEK